MDRLIIDSEENQEKFWIKYSLWQLNQVIERTVIDFTTMDPVDYSLHLAAIHQLLTMRVLDEVNGSSFAEWLSMPLEDLVGMIQYGQSFDANSTVEVVTPVAQQCHTVSAFTWVLNQHLLLCTGVSDKTNAHSWLYDPQEKILYEPTPYDRETYYGYLVEKPVCFVQGEIENIRRLYEKGDLPEVLYQDFIHSFNRLVKERS